MDVVYVVRTGGNDELRYSLRSLANVTHDRVWIVGHAEPWLVNVGVIPTPQPGVGKQEQVQANWAAMLDHPVISDPFIVMNDDIFITEPVAELIPWHRGPLAKHAAESPERPRNAGLARTVDLLKGLGVDEPLSYETHTPLVVDRKGWAAALEHCAADPFMVPKSIYGNLAHLDGYYGGDVKVHSDDAKLPIGPFLSTSDRSWARHRAGWLVRDLFEQPSRYEVRS
jgi:hypothetical protein